MSIAFNPTSEQRQIVDAMRQALAETFPATPLATLAELGAFGLAAPEAVGGTGATLVEETLLFTELGRFLAPPSALATALAARLALSADQSGLAREFVAGTRTACLAHSLPGAQAQLLDADGASHALLWDDEGMTLFRLDGVERQAVAGMDRTVSLHRCALSAAPVEARGTSLLREAHLLNAAMLLGMAEATLTMAVDYAKVRTQFGQTIGAFQAVKHRCANMALRVEALRAQVAMAALAVRDGWPDAGLQVDACRMLASRAALANARDNIQVHGAIGFTAECNAHRYLLRAHLHEHVGGSMKRAIQRLTQPTEKETT